MKISQLVEQYLADLPIGCVLTEEQIARHLRNATRQYCGYAVLASAQYLGGPIENLPGAADLFADIEVSDSELAIIQPLWLLYIEKESAAALEASRSQGADPWGRATSEVIQSILDYERELPRLAFSYEVRSI